VTVANATTAAAALVEVEGLAFGYPGRAVLREVSFRLEAGALVALCGPNGAGKSTLLRLLLGLHRPAAGWVRLGGARLGDLTRRQIARRAALLPQESPLDLPLTVREVVALGRLPHLGRFQAEGPADARAVERALVATDTAPLGDLAQEAPLLLLDEPIAGLDLVHQLEALDLLRALVDEGRSAIVALHDLSLAARGCDRMLLLAGGTLQADAPPAAVLTPENLERFFGVRAEVRADSAGRPLVVPLEPAARERTP
jgi:iron complex transport system ATP-binding protein